MKRFLWFGHDDGERTHGGGLDDLCGDFETLAEAFGAIEADTSCFAAWGVASRPKSARTNRGEPPSTSMAGQALDLASNLRPPVKSNSLSRIGVGGTRTQEPSDCGMLNSLSCLSTSGP